MSGRLLVRRLMPMLVALSVIAVTSSVLDDAHGATKRRKKPPRRPPAAAPAITPPKPVEEPPPSTGAAEPAPSAAAPVATPVPVAAAPLAADKHSLLIIAEGTNARDLDVFLRKAFDGQVAVATPAQVREALTPKEQRIFDRPPNKRDLTRAMKRVAKRAGVDGVIYANVDGSSKEGYEANVLLVYRTGKVGIDGSVPVSKMVKRGKRLETRWQYANVASLVQPGVDGLGELPAPGEKGEPSGEPSLGESPANFDANRGTATGEPIVEEAPIDGGAISEEIDDGHSVDMFETRMRAPIIVKAGMQAGHREFSYNEPITSNLRDYSVGVAPLMLLEAELYPFGTTTIPVLKNIGWYASYAQAFGIKSSFKTSTTSGEALEVSNSWRTWQVGLHSRFRIGERFAVGPQLTYGFLAYRFNFADADDERAYEVPDVRYNFLRLGVEARMPISFLDIAVGSGYYSVLTGGRVASQYFPNSSTAAVDAYVTVGLPISRFFALDGSVNYQRYFYAMRPEVSDTYVAGGALDQYFTASLSLVYLMGANE